MFLNTARPNQHHHHHHYYGCKVPLAIENRRLARQARDAVKYGVVFCRQLTRNYLIFLTLIRLLSALSRRLLIMYPRAFETNNNNFHFEQSEQ